MAESEEKLKSLLIRVKEKSEKTGLKLSIQTTKISHAYLVTDTGSLRGNIEWKRVFNTLKIIFCL